MVFAQSKSVGLGVVLTLVFGGFGVFYASILGGIVMALAELVALALCLVFVGALMLPVVHAVSLIWTIVAINAHNRRVLARCI